MNCANFKILTEDADNEKDAQKENGPPGGREHVVSAPLEEGENAAAGYGEDQNASGWKNARTVNAHDALDPLEFRLEAPSFRRHLKQKSVSV